MMAVGGYTVPSIVLFRLADMTPSNVARRLHRILSEHSSALLAGAFVVVTESAVRSRPLPIGRGEA